MKLVPQQLRRAVVREIEHDGQRLIDLLVSLWPDKSASGWRQQIDRHRVWVNSYPARLASHPVALGDSLLHAPIEADSWQLLYEEPDFWLLNKPFDASVFEAKECLEPIAPDLVYFVHRLDKMTSGALLVAKNQPAAVALQALFRQQSIQKDYLAIVWGKPDGLSGVVDAALVKSANPHGGVRVTVAASEQGTRSAQTFWRLLAHHEGISVLHCRPLSGRTHQIRVHLHHLGLPVVGDREYLPSSRQRRWQGNIFFAQHLLHAYGLKIQWQGKQRSLYAPLSTQMQRALALLCPSLLQHCQKLAPMERFP